MSEETGSNDGIFVIAFVEENGAGEALEKLKGAKKQKSVDYWDAVTIRRDERGRYYYSETKDMSTPIGAGIGAVVGGLIGLAAGPAGVALGTGVGAVIGGSFASADTGIKDERIEEVGHALESGNSALLIVPNRDRFSAMREYAGDEEITAAMHKLTEGISEHMAQRQNVIYHITAAGRSVSCHEADPDNDFARILSIGAE